ncbi:hypothetical protein [Candidatus Leptofilum sp.]
MTLTVRRKVVYLLAAAALVLMLAGLAVTATPVFADCTSSSSTSCSG